MIMGKYILFFASILGSTASFGQYPVTPATVPKNLHIYSSSGNAYVDMVAHDCSGYRYELLRSHVAFDNIFALLLSAQVSGKKVQLRFSGCNSIPQGVIEGAYLVD
jgi:hypothetical protein